MNPIAKFAIAAAAVVVVAIVGYSLLGPATTTQFGGVASPSAEPSSSPAPLAPTTGEIDAGRYRWSSPSFDVSFDLRDGWTGKDNSPGVIAKNDDQPDGFNVDFTNPRYDDIKVFGDACKQGEPVWIGETVDDLVAALDDQESTEAVVGEIAAGSVTGKRIELRQTPGLDRSQCSDGAEGPFRIWVNAAEDDYNAWTYGQGVIYVFDVDGTRLVFAASFGVDAPEAQIEEVDAIVESFEFTPH